MLNADLYVETHNNTKGQNSTLNILKNIEHLWHWGPDERVLDAGCGPGDVTAKVIMPWLPADFRLLLGVDISHPMIKHAEAYYATDRVKFEVADIGSDILNILENPKYSAGFDKVVSFFALHWLQDLRRGVHNLFLLMRPGGQGFFYFPIDGTFNQAYGEARAKPQWKDFFRNVTRKVPECLGGTNPEEEFRNMLSDVGFEIDVCKVEAKTSEMENMSSIKGMIESLDQDINCVPLDLKEAYVNDCVEILKSGNFLEVRDDSTVLQILPIITCVVKKPLK